MATLTRTSFQGVTNIVRFNWHFYVLSAGAVGLFWMVARFTPYPYGALAMLAAIAILVPTLVSLGVSYYVYDRSDLYSLNWLGDLAIPKNAQLLTINAGFDETSALLAQRFPQAILHVYDFYDPAKHTEISIKRARNAYLAYPGTQPMSTAHIPLPDDFIDVAFLILAAHEIRNETERITFFNELRRTLRPDGLVVVVEHLRDPPNFGAYTVGFMHFQSKNTWLTTFNQSGFLLVRERKITSFISAFFLQKNGYTT